MKRWACALLSGSVIAALPFLILQVDSESILVSSLQWIAKCLMVPGVLVGFLAAGGNVHIIDYRVMTVANGVFYAGISYRLLVSRGKRHDRLRRETGEQNDRSDMRKS